MLNPRKEERPSTAQLLEFEFFSQAGNPMKKSKSMNMLHADSQVSMKDLADMRVKLAKLRDTNRGLQVKNAELQSELSQRKDRDTIQKIETLKLKLKKTVKANKENDKLRAGLEQDLEFSRRELRELKKKNVILQKSLGKGEAVMQNIKKLNKYLFKTSQVSKILFLDLLIFLFIAG